LSYAQALESDFARAVRVGLTRAGQKTLPCRYLYDEIGSALFEAITFLPEYGLTRADARLLECHASEIAARIGGRVAVVELGSGTGSKTRSILNHFGCRPDAVYFPIDVSPSALDRCAREFAPLIPTVPLESNYLDGLEEVASERKSDQRLLVLFLGSTIGNFEPEEAGEFLAAIRACLQPGDALLLGADLVKPAEQLLSAYDDPTGVTAAFNLNLLGRINRELNADFDLRKFQHQVRYQAHAQRVEMHLRSLANQAVSIPAAHLVVDFAADETIWTESSYKFRLEQIAAMARAGAFRIDRQWVDCDWPFAETLMLA
jgi:L-histidine Nalpha-methyltransferase